MTATLTPVLSAALLWLRLLLRSEAVSAALGHRRGQPALQDVEVPARSDRVAVFGIDALIFGPAIAAMFIADWHIYAVTRSNATP